MTLGGGARLAAGRQGSVNDVARAVSVVGTDVTPVTPDEPQPVNAGFKFLAEREQQIGGGTVIRVREASRSGIRTFALLDVGVQKVSPAAAAQVFREDAGPEKGQVADVAVNVTIPLLGGLAGVLGLQDGKQGGHLGEVASERPAQQAQAIHVHEVDEQVGQIRRQLRLAKPEFGEEGVLHQSAEVRPDRMIGSDRKPHDLCSASAPPRRSTQS